MELGLTPAGRISARRAQDAAEVGTSTSTHHQLDRIADALASSQGEALFLLASERFDTPLSPAWIYWRELSTHYLQTLCLTPDIAGLELESIPPPADHIADWVRNAPPMPGAEYLSEGVLAHLWQELDNWVRAAVQAQGAGLTGFLQRRAPLWHQVGRVCFHLAENRRSEEYPFAFLATYAPSVASGSRVQYQPLSSALRELAGAKNKQALIRLLSPVQQAAERSELVKDLIASGDLYQPLAWTPREAYRFLKEVPLFEASGILVRMPDWWKKRPRPRVTATIGDTRQAKFNVHGLLDFKVELALGEEQLSQAEWQSLMQSEDGLVLLRGQWVEVNRDKLQEALTHWKQIERQSSAGISFLEGMRLLAGVPADLAGDTQDEERNWSFVQAGDWLGDILKKLRNPDALTPPSGTSALQATLRPYQQVGVNWLQFLTSLGLGACLADDMGLGKTMQVLALFLASRKQADGKPSLLVLPASLLGNWKAELARFAPDLRVLFVHPSETPKSELERIAENPRRVLRETDVVATSYGMLLRQDWLSAERWHLAVLDEAQAIKNPTASQTKAVKKIQASARIALTGTPVENRLGDLWSLFDFICPGLLGTQTKFKAFAKRLHERPEHRYAPLRDLVQPYILRRMKTDRRIIDDLPDKVEVQAYCGLSKRQAAMYAKLVRELRDQLDNSDGMRRRGIVLAYLMRFKQICNHPSQLLGDGQYAAEDSGKFARLREICEEIASRQEKVLVFTQFREMTEPLAEFLTQVFGCAGLVLHGNTTVKRRQALVDQFQRDDGPPYFILSLKAGGTGLNLTAASQVIHFDRWWNPAVENQATDRAFRIGQKRNVLVHKFVCRGTIEERIDALINEKRQLATELLEGGAEKMLTEMSDDELIRFVSLDVTRTEM
jgi:non-specific serine/threonine protein kinase